MFICHNFGVHVRGGSSPEFKAETEMTGEDLQGTTDFS